MCIRPMILSLVMCSPEGDNCTLTNNIMTQPAPTKEDLSNLIENYAWHIIDGLDRKSADQMLFDLLTREYEKMTWDEVTEEIVDLYDEDTLIDLLPDAK